MTTKIHGHSVAELVIFLTAVCLAIGVGWLAYENAISAVERGRVERSAYETIASNPNPVIVCRNGVIEIFNPAAEEALGVRAASVVGNVAAETIIPEKYRAAHIAATAKLQLLPKGSIGSRTYILPMPDGSSGKTRRWWVTTQYRVLGNGDVLTTARLVDYTLQSQVWEDVETKKSYHAKIEMEPVEIVK